MDASKILQIVIQSIADAAGFEQIGAASEAAADAVTGSAAASGAALDGTTGAAAMTAEGMRGTAAAAAEMSGASDAAASSFIALGDTSDEYAANLAIIQGAAGGAVGEILLLGDAAKGTADTMVESAAVTDEAAGATDAAGAAAADAGGGFDILKGSLLSTIAPLLALFGIYEGGKAILKDTIDSTELNQSANAVLANTLRQTGDAAGLNITQMDKLADSNSKNSVVSENMNLNAEQILSSYTDLGKTTFPKAASAVDDLATKAALMKGQAVPSLQQTDAAAKALGKALEDPSAGMSALTRYGIALTAEQKEQIKALQDNSNATLKQAESIQGVTKAGAEALTNWSHMTTAQQTAAETTYGLTSVQIAQAQAFGKQNGATAAQTALLKALAPAHGAAAAEAATLGGKIAILKNNMENAEVGIGNWATSLLPALGNAMNVAANFAISVLAPGFNAVGEAMKNAAPALEGLLPVLKIVAEVVGVTLVVAFRVLLEVFATIINVGAAVISFFEKHRLAMVALAGAVGGILIPILAAAAISFGGMAAAAVVSAAAAAAAWVVAMAPFILIGAVVTAIVYEVITHWKQISTTAEQVWHDVTNFVGHMASDIGNFLGEAVKFFISLPADILGVYADADTWLYDVGKNIIEGLINGVKDMVGDLTGAVKNVASGAIDTVKNILGIHSPSSVFAEIGTNIGQGLVQGVQGTKSTVAGALTSLTNVTLAPPTVSGGGAAVGGGGGAAGAGVVIESGGSLVTVQYNGRGQFTIQDAAAMGKEIILAMRAQGLATTNMNNMASLR